MLDIVIIGAGITGCFLARDLSKYNCSILVLDKENDVACGATMANSAIIHSGHDPKEGTRKAQFNVRGNRMYEDVCEELECAYQKIGAYVCATNVEEVEQLEHLKQQAETRNIPCAIHSALKMNQREPHLSEQVIAGLFLPTTAIVYPWEIAIALMENAIMNGVQCKLNEEVCGISKTDVGFSVQTKNCEISAKIVINCCGVYADDIYEMLTHQRDFSITARKGEYYVLDHMEQPFVNHVLYPVPSKKGKGVLVVPTVYGNTLLGPTSIEIESKSATNNTYSGLDSVKEQLARLVKLVPFDKLIRTFAGNRPSGSTKDFIVEESVQFPDFYNVAAIESPGLASAPAISEYIRDLIVQKNDLKLKEDILIGRRKVIRCKALSQDEKNKWVQKDNRYGKIVCRCEQITEGEIVDAIHRPCGATTVKGVKKRVGPGMGRCQGGFCEPLVIEILARELKKDKSDIVLDGLKSNLLQERTKQHENH